MVMLEKGRFRYVDTLEVVRTKPARFTVDGRYWDIAGREMEPYPVKKVPILTPAELFYLGFRKGGN